MGTRVNYILAGEEGQVAAVLYANNSHPDVDPDQLFMKAVMASIGPTATVIDLLSQTYPSYSPSNHHRAGDTIFSIDRDQGDREYVLRAVYGAGGVCRIERDNLDGTVDAVDPKSVETL